MSISSISNDCFAIGEVVANRDLMFCAFQGFDPHNNTFISFTSMRPDYLLFVEF